MNAITSRPLREGDERTGHGEDDGSHDVEEMDEAEEVRRIDV
jgi:hypothetical protein